MRYIVGDQSRAVTVVIAKAVDIHGVGRVGLDLELNCSSLVDADVRREPLNA